MILLGLGQKKASFKYLCPKGGSDAGGVYHKTKMSKSTLQNPTMKLYDVSRLVVASSGSGPIAQSVRAADS